MTYDGVDNEQFQGFDAFSDEEETNSEEFLKVYGEYFNAWPELPRPKGRGFSSKL
jgi:hypothetical protein